MERETVVKRARAASELAALRPGPLEFGGEIKNVLRVGEADRLEGFHALRAGDERHAAVGPRRVLERDPDRDLVALLDVRPVVGVLVPRGFRAFARDLEQRLVVP